MLGRGNSHRYFFLPLVFALVTYFYLLVFPHSGKSSLYPRFMYKKIFVRAGPASHPLSPRRKDVTPRQRLYERQQAGESTFTYLLNTNLVCVRSLLLPRRPQRVTISLPWAPHLLGITSAWLLISCAPCPAGCSSRPSISPSGDQPIRSPGYQMRRASDPHHAAPK